MEKGNISNTQFSDILRINLLARYGGYWIDATCLLTQSTPNGWISNHYSCIMRMGSLLLHKYKVVLCMLNQTTI